MRVHAAEIVALRNPGGPQPQRMIDQCSRWLARFLRRSGVRPGEPAAKSTQVTGRSGGSSSPLRRPTFQAWRNQRLAQAGRTAEAPAHWFKLVVHGRARGKSSRRPGGRACISKNSAQGPPSRNGRRRQVDPFRWSTPARRALVDVGGRRSPSRRPRAAPLHRQAAVSPSRVLGKLETSRAAGRNPDPGSVGGPDGPSFAPGLGRWFSGPGC